jgi:hypothetical protein
MAHDPLHAHSRPAGGPLMARWWPTGGPLSLQYEKILTMIYEYAGFTVLLA